MVSVQLRLLSWVVELSAMVEVLLILDALLLHREEEHEEELVPLLLVLVLSPLMGALRRKTAWLPDGESMLTCNGGGSFAANTSSSSVLMLLLLVLLRLAFKTIFSGVFSKPPTNSDLVFRHILRW